MSIMRVGRIREGDGARLVIEIDGTWWRTPYADLLDFFDAAEGGAADVDDLAAQATTAIEERVEGGGLLAPMSRFRRDILCTGWNYPNHFEESRGLRGGQEVDKPDHPTFFTKAPDTVIGPHDAIGIDPAMGESWDYEAELAIVIGRRGRSVSESSAWDYVWGYTLANDVSHRETQRAHGGQWLKGKSLDATMPLGPVIVSGSDFDPDTVQVECELNGVPVQSAAVREMAFPIPRLISELSRGMTLHPGDLLLTGTPAGVGNARDPQLFLQPGDSLVTIGRGVGEMINPIEQVDLIGELRDDDGPRAKAGGRV